MSGRRRSPIDAIELARLIHRARRMIADGSARAIRERAGLSRVELARRLGVTSGSIRHWELGEHETHDPLILRAWLATLDELAAIVGDGQDLDDAGDEQELKPTGTEGGEHAT